MRHRNLWGIGPSWARALRRHRVTVWVVVGTIVGFGAILIVVGPVSWLVAGDTVRDLHGKERADALNAVRQTVLTAVGGSSVLLGVGFTARSYRLSRRGQVTERFSTAIGQLASDKRAERLGAVYGLEHVMAESPQDHATVVGVLAAFVRENAGRTPLRPEPVGPDGQGAQRPLAEWGTAPAVDITAAVEVLARRPERFEARRMDLRSTELAGLPLRSFEFEAPPRLSRAFLTWADLCRADLRGADLSGAILNSADLRSANLAQARLDGAGLFKADLRDALLADTTLLGADLSGADLRDAGQLTAQQLAGAVIDDQTQLPPALADDPWVVARLADCRARRDPREAPAPTPPRPVPPPTR
ncbi:pentapeptide repeat-containing protein [Streptomyces sp. NPDC059002]|uniref:pentapeptide repeat-containing protein n=1 Tax=Streptomyces sp. NPDC059002 TaxID=3346690 RepID=UPI0036BA9853